MEGFGALKPAFFVRMQTNPQLIMGKTFSEAGMAVGPIDHGTVRSVPGYGAEPFEGQITNGADVFHVESSFKSVRLDFRSVISVPEGEAIYFSFVGFIEGNADTAAILRGASDAQSTGGGSSFLSGTFETGNQKWLGMTRKVYVGSQRLIKEPGKPLFVEINLSEVGASIE